MPSQGRFDIGLRVRLRLAVKFHLHAFIALLGTREMDQPQPPIYFSNDPTQNFADCVQRCPSVLKGQLYVDRQARQIPFEQVDGGPAWSSVRIGYLQTMW